MTPGPIQFFACLSCGLTMSRETLGSGNLINARRWTDGKCEAPMLPDQPPIAACPRCKAPFWVRDLELLCEYFPFGRSKPRGRIPVPLKETVPMREVTTTDIAALLDRHPTRDRVRTLRIRLWWRHNDRFRHALLDIMAASGNVGPSPVT